MAKADPTNPSRIEHACNRITDGWKQRPETGMKQQRLLVPHYKLIELQIEVREERGNAEDVRRNFRNLGHGGLVLRGDVPTGYCLGWVVSTMPVQPEGLDRKHQAVPPLAPRCLRLCDCLTGP